MIRIVLAIIEIADVREVIKHFVSQYHVHQILILVHPTVDHMEIAHIFVTVRVTMKFVDVTLNVVAIGSHIIV